MCASLIKMNQENSGNECGNCQKVSVELKKAHSKLKKFEERVTNMEGRLAAVRKEVGKERQKRRAMEAFHSNTVGEIKDTLEEMARISKIVEENILRTGRKEYQVDKEKKKIDEQVEDDATLPESFCSNESGLDTAMEFPEPEDDTLLPSLSRDMIKRYQENDPIVGKAKAYLEAGRRPTKSQMRNEKKMVLELLKEWDKLQMIDGVILDAWSISWYYLKFLRKRLSRVYTTTWGTLVQKKHLIC